MQPWSPMEHHTTLGPQKASPKRGGPGSPTSQALSPGVPKEHPPEEGGPGSPTSQVLSPATLAMGRQHSRYWQRSPMKVGRQRQLGWLPWLTVQLPLFRQ